MFQRHLFSWAITLILLTSSLRAQEAVIGSRGSFAGLPTRAAPVLTGHKYAVHAVAISPDMKTIVSGGGENELPIILKKGQKQNIDDKDSAERVQGEGVIWEWKPAKRRFLLHPLGRIKGLTFTPDGKVIGGFLEKAPLFRGYNIPGNPVLFYDAKTGKGVGQYEGDVLNTPKALSFSEDGLVVVVAGGFHDPELIHDRFWGDIRAQNPRHGYSIRLMQYPGMAVRQEFNLMDKTLGVTFSADSRFVAYNVDRKVHVVVIKTGQEQVVIPNAPSGNMQISPDGKVLAILEERIAQPYVLHLYSLEHGEAIGPPAFVDSTHSRAFAFSPDSQQLAIATCWADDENLICLWSLRKRQETARFVGHEDHVSSLAFSRDGSFLVSGSLDKTVRIWKLRPE